MDNKYWLNRWEKGETAWQQTKVEPALATYFSDLKPTRVFVPFCGKSLDLFWLASKGHEVIGVELSELACRSFFEENKIPFVVETVGKFSVYRGGNISIYQGDFFDFGKSELGEVGAVYDRAALIALPLELRTKYAAHMIEILSDSAMKQKFRFLQIVIERFPHDLQGPPFSVQENELHDLYSKKYRVISLARSEVENKTGVAGKMEERAYSICRQEQS